MTVSFTKTSEGYTAGDWTITQEGARERRPVRRANAWLAYSMAYDADFEGNATSLSWDKLEDAKEYVTRQIEWDLIVSYYARRSEAEGKDFPLEFEIVKLTTTVKVETVG